MEEKRKKRGVGRWIILAIVVWAVGSGTLAGRSWTTTEGEEFEADLVRYKNGIVIVKILGASPEAFDIRLYELETKQASGN